MKCPVCQTELKRILYGGMPVFRCFGCAGYLIPEKRFDVILRCEEAPVELLKQEVINESKPDTTQDIKCPRCFYVMLKLKLNSPVPVALDVCRDKKCGLLWLDGGELAKLQLASKMASLEKSGRGWNFQSRIDKLRGEHLGVGLKKLPESRSMGSMDFGGF